MIDLRLRVPVFSAAFKIATVVSPTVQPASVTPGSPLSRAALYASRKALTPGLLGVLRVVRIDEVVGGVDTIGSRPGKAEEQLRRAGVGHEHQRHPRRVLRLGVGEFGEEGGALQPQWNRNDRIGQLPGNASDLRDRLVVDVGFDRLLVDDLEPEQASLLLEFVGVGLAELAVDGVQRHLGAGFQFVELGCIDRRLDVVRNERARGPRVVGYLAPRRRPRERLELRDALVVQLVSYGKVVGRADDAGEDVDAIIDRSIDDACCLAASY